ncbi:DUF4282 domain-containing protein [Corynebacterium camporealensis]
MAEHNSEPYSWGIPEEFQQPQQPAQQAEQPQQTDSTTTTTAPNNAPDSNESGVKKFFNRHVRHGFLFEGLWDFKFKDFITLGVVEVLYVISIIFAVFVWFAFILATFVAFVQTVFSDYEDGAGMVFLTWIGIVLLGWIPAWLWIVASRLFFAAIVAVIRIAQNSSDISGQMHNKL